MEYDKRDNILVGRPLRVRGIISFHAETVAQLRSELETAVKDFLADGTAEGVKPEKPASTKLLLQVTPEIHGKALVDAQASGKSLNQRATELPQGAVLAALDCGRASWPSAQQLAARI